MLKHFKLPKGVYKYTIAAILLAVPLYPKFPFVRIPGTFVSIRLEDVLLAFAGILVFWAYLGNFKVLLKDKLVRSTTIFLAVAHSLKLMQFKINSIVGVSLILVTIGLSFISPYIGFAIYILIIPSAIVSQLTSKTYHPGGEKK